MMKYSPSARGFFDAFSANVPADAREVSAAVYAELMAAQEQGQIIAPDASGDPVAMDPPPPNLKAYAAAKRFAVETGGIVVAGQSIATDRGSQALIQGAYNMAKDGLIPTFDFKAQSGWVTLTAAQAVAIGQAVGSHVQVCFSAERQVEAAIDAGTITTPAEVDAWAWPSTT